MTTIGIVRIFLIAMVILVVLAIGYISIEPNVPTWFYQLFSVPIVVTTLLIAYVEGRKLFNEIPDWIAEASDKEKKKAAITLILVLVPFFSLCFYMGC